MLANVLQILNFTANSARNRTLVTLDRNAMSLEHSIQHVRILPTPLSVE